VKRSTIWILVSVIAVALAVTLVLVFTLPSSEPGGVDAQTEVEEETVTEEPQSEQPEPEQSEQPDETQDQVVEEEGTVNPGQGESNPQEMVISFPDPVDDGGEEPQEEGPSDEENPSVTGKWILEMYGAGYGFNNLYVRLQKDGSVSVPDDYLNIFEITSSQYNWEAGKPDFSASIQAVLKMGSEQTAIPVKIDLTGTVSEPLTEIEGSFTAAPQQEMQVPLFIQGTFKMQR
jgi:hypothetical protein